MITERSLHNIIASLFCNEVDFPYTIQVNKVNAEIMDEWSGIAIQNPRYVSKKDGKPEDLVLKYDYFFEDEDGFRIQLFPHMYSVKDGRIVFVNHRKIFLEFLREPTCQALAKTSDADRFAITAEATVEFDPDENGLPPVAVITFDREPMKVPEGLIEGSVIA